ncbi:MAG: transcriptional regulator [candidate division WOR-3 bacterium]
MEIKKLDPIIHEKTRFLILLFLLKNKEVDFKFLKDATQTTEGNLSSHLKVLEEKGFINVRKTFIKKRPKTFYTLTEEGERRLIEYINNLKHILKKIGR